MAEWALGVGTAIFGGSFILRPVFNYLWEQHFRTVEIDSVRDPDVFQAILDVCSQPAATLAFSKLYLMSFPDDNNPRGMNASLTLGFGKQFLEIQPGVVISIERKRGENTHSNQEILILEVADKAFGSLMMFLEKALSQYVEKNQSKVFIYAPSPTATWICVTKKEARSINTVFLDENTVKIKADLEHFLKDSTRKHYAKCGKLYKRGYLFYGPPGNGKTSYIFALAGHFKHNVYMLNLSNPDMSDSDLQKLFASLPPRCFLVLEDVEAARSESSNRNNITTSGILNVLDGLFSKEGVITILTTNFPEKLEPRITRPGRVDKKYLFDFPQLVQIRALMQLNYPNFNDQYNRLNQAVNEDFRRFKISMATLQGFVDTFADPSSFVDKVLELIQNPPQELENLGEEEGEETENVDYARMNRDELMAHLDQYQAEIRRINEHLQN